MRLLYAGSSLTESIEVSRLAEKALMDKFPEIKHVVAKIGTAEVPTDPMAVEDADVMIIMKPLKLRMRCVNRVSRMSLFHWVPKARFGLMPPANGSPNHRQSMS